jgi:UDPglucose 6-dehydrogenase
MIGICGIGFVGGALKTLLEKKYKIFAYDPYKPNSCKKEDINSCEIVFLCVPTPFSWEKMDYDYSAIDDCLSWIEKDKLIVIKSTVQPGTCKKMSEKYGHKIVFNPEFLREVSAVEDMLNADRTVLGGNIDDCQKICNIYKAVYPFEMLYAFTTWEIAELTKIATNTFLASKVSFCNEIKDLCDNMKISYDAFREVWLLDKRIGRSHTQVTEKGGFSGHCFPKDLNALITKMLNCKIEPTLHNAIWETNRKYRKEFSGDEYRR